MEQMEKVKPSILLFFKTLLSGEPVDNGKIIDTLKQKDMGTYKELINSEKRREEMIKKLQPVIQKRKAMNEYGVEAEETTKTRAPKIQSAKIQKVEKVEEDREL